MTLPPHPLTNFEIQEYYQNEPRLNGVFSRDNLPNSIKKNCAYVINLDEYHDIGTHWVNLLFSIVKAFQSILKQSNRKPNKIWVDKGSEFYNVYFKKWLQDNDIVMYSTHNEGKSVVAERFIRTLKSKIYKYLTSISKNVYIDKLDDIVDEYNNTYHTTIKMKPINVKDNTYINTSKEINNKDPKFKVGDHVRISKYKNIFAKGYMPNWSEEVLVIKKVKNTIPSTYVINDLNDEEIIGTFYEKELQKTNQEEFRIEKVIRRKGHKLYVKWKGYDNSFNSWIDKKDIIK